MMDLISVFPIALKHLAIHQLVKKTLQSGFQSSIINFLMSLKEACSVNELHQRVCCNDVSAL